MKILLSLLLVTSICLMTFTSCIVRIPDETVTGDVKNKEENAVDTDAGDNNSSDIIPDHTSTKTEKVNAEKVIESLGGTMLEDDEYLGMALEFVQAVKDADTDIISEFTGGKPEYYEFLSDVQIEGFKVYPFELTQQKRDELDNSKKYWRAFSNFIIEFDVKESSADAFVSGKNLYYLGIEPYSAEGYAVCCFVPAKDAFMFATESYENDFTAYFISEFCSLYVPYLSEGRNYAEDFSFGESVHMITHLMARSGKYSDYPPYSLDEINDFIEEAFDGNEGFEREPFDRNRWYYGSTGTGDDTRLYGCSYAHGGTTVEHKITDVSSPEKDETVYKVQIYADYANFAPAYTVILNFETEKGKLPSLEMVRILDVTGRNPAYVSL